MKRAGGVNKHGACWDFGQCFPTALHTSPSFRTIVRTAGPTEQIEQQNIGVALRRSAHDTIGELTQRWLKVKMYNTSSFLMNQFMRDNFASKILTFFMRDNFAGDKADKALSPPRRHFLTAAYAGMGVADVFCYCSSPTSSRHA